MTAGNRCLACQRELAWDGALAITFAILSPIYMGPFDGSSALAP